MIGKANIQVDIDSLLSKVSEVNLVCMYLPQVKEIPSVINSPLRKDEHPSFRVYSPDGSRIRWYDYVTGESGGILDLLTGIWGCTLSDALVRIQKDLPKGSGSLSVSPSLGRHLHMHSADSSCIIRTTMRRWEQKDFAYWASYGVPERWLRHADIFPISHIFIISETGYIRTIVADPYAYTFIERKDGKCTEKVYQPFNKQGMKWRSGHDSSVWDLWTKLPPQGEKVIITSSRKDALCIWANSGIPSVSLQSEAINVKPSVMEELKGRFKQVFVLFDNDLNREKNYGRIDGQKLSEQFNIKQIEIPDVYMCKDISDLYHKYGQGTVVKVIRQLCFEEKMDNT